MIIFREQHDTERFILFILKRDFKVKEAAGRFIGVLTLEHCSRQCNLLLSLHMTVDGERSNQELGVLWSCVCIGGEVN